MGIALLGVYAGGVGAFSYFTLPNTYVNDYDQSFKPRSTLLAQEWQDFDIVAKGRNDKMISFNTKDINYEESVSKNASLDQNPFIWPLAFFNRDDFEIDYKVAYNKEKLDNVIESSQLMKDVTDPVDAKIFMGDEGKYVIKKETEGDKIAKKELKKTLIHFLTNHQEKVKLSDKDYVHPSVRYNDEDLNLAKNKANELASLDIKYALGKYKTYELTGTKLMKLFDWNGENFVVNKGKVEDYFTKMADETDTYGTVRKFNATGIGEIEVNPGLYGWKIDVEQSTDDFDEIVKADKSGTYEPSYADTALIRDKNNNDIGNTYIEVDLSRQYMRYYQDGELLMETYIVSGNTGMGSATNVGVGKILEKVTNTYLKGENYDGSPYKTPVAYWMPIGWDGEGIHDSDWRWSYGGDIYYYDGSHGCINTPPGNVPVIFNNVQIGTPVVVYESSTSNSPAMSY
ncbi:MAG: L,D-transpeptidase family protein [Peptoniphilaceae bacterium]|nr:L,D-transpeptidase/peptidoglycan binding protein [Peptoniphilaceae bacterium]MDD7383917.1 L,D-transpeptidase family protein [Peptoniphilaceae bacterium]MDY3738060.1 L,D-transpeptidase family protein [Peptoniphilaceae bacterium]